MKMKMQQSENVSKHTLSMFWFNLTFCPSPFAPSPGFKYLINQLSFPRSEEKDKEKV